MSAVPLPGRRVAPGAANTSGVKENRLSLAGIAFVGQRVLAPQLRAHLATGVRARGARRDPRDLETETPGSDPLPANDQNAVPSSGQIEPRDIGPEGIAAAGGIVVLVDRLFVDGHDQRTARADQQDRGSRAIGLDLGVSEGAQVGRAVARRSQTRPDRRRRS